MREVRVYDISVYEREPYGGARGRAIAQTNVRDTECREVCGKTTVETEDRRRLDAIQRGRDSDRAN